MGMAIKRPLAFLLTWIGMLSLLGTQGYCSSVCVSDLTAQIEAILSQPQFTRSSWGILVQDLSTNTTLYALNDQQYFVPASNNKVLTTAAALILMGAQFVYETPVYISKTRNNELSICISGAGDPSINFKTLQDATWSIAYPEFWSISSLVVDDNYFWGDGQPFPQSWEWEDITADYGAAPQSLVVNENAIPISVTPADEIGKLVNVTFLNVGDEQAISLLNTATTVSSASENTLSVGYLPGAGTTLIVDGSFPINATTVTLSLSAMNSTQHFADLIAYAFATVPTVKTVGPISYGECDTSAPAYIITSNPLVELMNYTLLVSDNLYAEIFLRTLGAHFPQQPSVSSQDDGIVAVSNALGAIGVDTSTFVQVDGSGLSRQNLVSPQALVQTLSAVSRTKEGVMYRSLLPVAGETGTLSDRFVGTPAQGIVQAKTGTMSGVSALSGYVEPPTYPSTLVFSILVNGSNQPTPIVEDGIDSIVVLLAQLADC